MTLVNSRRASQFPRGAVGVEYHDFSDLSQISTISVLKERDCVFGILPYLLLLSVLMWPYNPFSGFLSSELLPDYPTIQSNVEFSGNFHENSVCMR